ncbi:ABC transporter permease subunit [Propionibacterium australiense]|uniref:ABC transporter permease subunit n=1 Tax=Propionibacterium australiense TaxID=119981 RepID=A0A383S568_9ACTN|nr:ABC transporter permease subunit [Propionibacterium australiense]RLP11681.1 ABC transporter permease subunit [Propionibacterium australiense]RLP12194.1 ABC transporter permease subunit [Propionibacterium australiense]SYZ32416.1 Binding-protein-dependent transport system inner membrane component [Propionibacterium australiense]VEH90253.1 Glutathione transport system permease protein gsiC [Propionibacterium australiense]
MRRRLLPEVTNGLVLAGSRLLAVGLVLLLIGILPWLGGTSAETTILRARYAELEATPENLARVRAELGLDRGPLVIFGQWFRGLVHGDLGNSWITGEPLGAELLRPFSVSLSLMGFSLLVAALVAGLMLIGPMRDGLRFRPNRGSGLGAAAVSSFPSFLLGSLLLICFAVWLKWFPPYGWKGLRYAVLPSVAMGVPTGAYFGRLLADAVAGAWGEPWVRTWALGGVPERSLCLAVLRRAMSGLLSQVALSVVSLTAGAVAVEQIFAIPGLGRSMLGSAAAQDVPAVQADMILLLALAAVVGTLAAIGRRLILGPALRAGAVPVPRPAACGARRAGVTALVATGLLVLLVALGLPRDPGAVDHGRLQAPGAGLLLGADASGRDMLARVAHGALSTLGVAALVVAATLVIGIVIGLCGRWATGLIEVVNALPALIVGLLVAAVTGPSWIGAAIAVAITAWAPLAAHTADLVAEVRARPYIQLQPLWGVGRVRQLVFGVLPAVVPTITRHAVLRLPGRALELASLSFLGLGAQPPSPEWGLLLSDGIHYVERAPWVVLAPTLALVLASVAAVAASSRGG